MTLQGAHSYNYLQIPDYDILIQPEDRRLLPLLRTLSAIGVSVQRTGSTLKFAPEGTPPATLDLASGLLSVSGSVVREAGLVSGVSDVTGEPEVYISEHDMADILGMEVAWNPDAYEYTFRASGPLQFFERRWTQNRSARGSDALSYALPGNLPPADPTRSLLPKLLFAKLQLQTSAIRRSDQARTTGSLSPPRGAVWAQILGGNLAARGSQRGESPRDGYKLDALSWNSVFDQTAVALGTGTVGLSDLVFPLLNLVGATVNGNVGPVSNVGSRDPSQLGKRQTYAPLRVFEGFAPVGSEVTLYVNGNVVDTKKVEPATVAPAGEGLYRFEGLNLFTRRLNEVRIVIKAPNGTEEEIRRRVLGTDLLLSKGRASFVGVAGRKRGFTSDDLSTIGSFAGGRLDYGIGQRLTVGASGAFQRDLFRDQDQYLLDKDQRRSPVRSLHLGTRVIVQPLDPLLLSLEGARSGWHADSSTGNALRIDAETHFGELNLRSGVFRYDPRFFDGQSATLSDIQGAHVGMSLIYGNGQQIGIVGSRLQDNLEGSRPITTRLNEIQASWAFRGLIPRSTTTVGGRQAWVQGHEWHRSYSLGLDGSLPWQCELRGTYEFGDDVHQLLRDEMSTTTSDRFDLPGRTSAGIDLPGASIGSGSLNSYVELRRRVGSTWQTSLSHRAAGSYVRSSLDVTRNAPLGSRWQARFSPGYDWDRKSPMIQSRLEVALDRTRRNRLELDTDLTDGQWLTRLSLQVQLDFAFSGLAPVPLFDSRLDPDFGGVKGRVFLDKNGNGLPDPGEQGVPGIGVTSDLGTGEISGNDGLFMLANSSSLRRARVGLDPSALSAIYTPTQGTQEAILRPGVFTEVNLGVAVLGTVSGTLLALPAPTDSVVAPTIPGGTAPSDTARAAGVAGVKILLVGSDGKVAEFSITGWDGAYTIVDVKPGSYKIRPDETSFPRDLRMDTGEITVEVRPEIDSTDVKAPILRGHFVRSQSKKEEPKGIEYKVFK